MKTNAAAYRVKIETRILGPKYAGAIASTGAGLVGAGVGVRKC